MTIISPEGLVLLSPSRLALLQCPRRGRQLLDERRGDPGIPARVGRAAHRVLASLARRGYPEDAFEVIPALTRSALRAEWTPGVEEQARYEAELHALTDLLREFSFEWERPALTAPFVESWVELRHTSGHILLSGRLDLLFPPADRDGGWAEVVDFKSGAQPMDPEEGDGQAPLPIVAQAALARAKLGLQCPVRVRNVYLRTRAEERWGLDQRTLVDGWRRVRELAADVLADRWPAVPGGHCERCRVQCEWAPRSLDAEELGLVDDPKADGE